MLGVKLKPSPKGCCISFIGSLISQPRQGKALKADRRGRGHEL